MRVNSGFANIYGWKVSDERSAPCVHLGFDYGHGYGGGFSSSVNLSPGEARQLAAELMSAASYAEAAAENE